jgi:hypothetical protein
VVWFDDWWAVYQDRPWLGVVYVHAMLSSFGWWGNVYKLCRVRNSFVGIG